MSDNLSIYVYFKILGQIMSDNLSIHVYFKILSDNSAIKYRWIRYR